MEEEDNDPKFCDLTGHDACDLISPILLLERTPPIEIKLLLLTVLPKFYEKLGADPYDFLNEFTRLCDIQKRLAGVSEDTFRLAVFLFTLSGEANAWFWRLPSRSIKKWTELKTAFLELRLLHRTLILAILYFFKSFSVISQ
ncbi:hypothetical protein AAHA92_14665 [Salvia divinorum]|uniref:Uncharacterized protein n=1 Tax=Salvia divinorum TaxID=28513 RepID=A0ABD1HD14_SALDI